MAVKRIVTNIPSHDIAKAQSFYEEILGLEILMNHGWIITYGNNYSSCVQISIATEGGNSTPVPNISIEVDNVDEIYEKIQKAGFEILYSIRDEDWGVRRFFVKDPFDQIVNILMHIE